MLRVTKIADYGIVMLTYLVAYPGTTHNARDMARVTRLPLPVASKVLKMLAREGVLTSHRGTKGGYGLARSPREITVAEVIRALEGPIAVTECTDRVRGDCDLENRCPVRTNWHRINQVIHRALENITLAEMAEPFPAALVGLDAGPKPVQTLQV